MYICTIAVDTIFHVAGNARALKYARRIVHSAFVSQSSLFSVHSFNMIGRESIIQTKHIIGFVIDL